MPLWYIPARRRFRADCATALQQILDALGGRAKAASKAIAERRGHYTRLHQERAEALATRERRADVSNLAPGSPSPRSATGP